MSSNEIILSIGIIGLVVVFVGSIVWVYRDARDRGKPGLLAALFVILFGWPVSLLAWLLFRPAEIINR